MPDRTPKPPDSNPPPVTVTVGVPTKGPEGVERRVEQQPPVADHPAQQFVFQQPSVDLLSGAKASTKILVSVGIVGFFLVLSAGLMAFFLWQFMRMDGERMALAREDREIARARESQQDRRHESQMAKIDALVTKIDAAMERMSGVGAEVRLSRAGIDRIGSDLADALSRLLAELKRLVPAPRKPVPPKGTEDVDLGGFLNPIWWLADHAPPKVMPGPADLAPSPRPCDAQSTGGAAR